MPDSILVVEYEPRYTDRVRQALAGQPFTPWFAKDGEEAIRALDSPQHPILIVLSSLIPKTTTEGMIKAVREREALRQTPILLTVAGYTGTSPKQDAMRIGASDILAKPFSESEFLGKVQQILSATGTGHALTSREIFGDILEEAKPAAAARRPIKTSDNVDKLIADTLGGMVQPKRPKTHSGATAIDKMVEDTLSGLGKSARKQRPAVDAASYGDNVSLSSPVFSAPQPVRQEEQPTDGTAFGQYVLLEKIATGGMAEVWKARKRGEEGFQKIVAIKKILPHLSDNQEFIEMFVDEAKLAAQLNHNNIIHIYDLGKIGPSYYIAMEYVDGHDLKSIMKRGEERGQPLGVELSLFIASKIGSALDYAHRRRGFDQKELGLVHRDVSPQNVLISHEGDIKLCDFGIAKAASKASHTQAGALKGKLQYMSPEQAWGRPIDRRADIFSLAAVLFEMLTGRKLFTGDNEMSVLEQVREARVVPPSQLNDEIPTEVDRVVQKALQKEPADRYQTAGEMAKDIDAILYGFRPTPTAADVAIYMHRLWSEEQAAPAVEQERTVVETPPPPPPPPKPVRPATAPGVVMPAWEARPAPQKRSVALPLTFVAIIVGGIVGGYFYVRSRNTSTMIAAPVAQEKVAAVPAAAPPVAETGTLIPLPTEIIATATTATTTTQPLLDPTLVDQEVQRLLAAERARLEQSRVAPPPPPPPQPVVEPEPQPVAVAPPPEPEPQPVTETVAEAAPTVREGDLIPPGTEGLVPPRVIRLGNVPYPPMAKSRRVAGTVMVNVLVSESGEVLDVRILRGVSPSVGLNEAAEQMVRRGTFAPPTKDGVRVKAWTTVPVNFRL
jgi:TonB family protein